MIDQFVEDDPPYWPTWMIDQIEQADVRAVRRLGDLSAALRGARTRDAGTRRQLGRARGHRGDVQDLPAAHRKFIAVAFEAEDLAHVPSVLLGAGRTGYVLDRDYDQLYRRITEQPRREPITGRLRDMSRPSPALPAHVTVRSRPPFVPTLFLDRTRETALLRKVVLEREHGIVVITGRAGIGKTALIGRFLQDLESRSEHGRLEFVYISADGSVACQPGPDPLPPARDACGKR